MTALTSNRFVPPEFKGHRYVTEGESGQLMNQELQGLESTRYAFHEFEARTKVAQGIRQPVMQPQPKLVKPQP